MVIICNRKNRGFCFPLNANIDFCTVFFVIKSLLPKAASINTPKHCMSAIY
ncbi:hypothetical protein ING2E5A_1157 [Petrimonas mucosa]|uniref:Uncharacterized protein n=1 Tax=Petrimonas mucosa TaxID=1642646 RepID=A0A1G4G623_9BACT|nr:hypothetical protein ING2E5A_1157 [Petrimonas mucosa]SFU50097.1 hypothetical protein SAMN05216364_101824 [Porphyromonadaceae bacterium KHP3R9]